MNTVDVRKVANAEAVSDVVVVGSGVAGLAAALGLAARGRRVTIMTKTEFGGGSSRWAQGGVAAALGSGDSPHLHGDDTWVAGAGIGDAEAIGILTREGPSRVRELMALGGRFDRDPDGGLTLGREGAHSRPRILHADGDATGREMVRTLSDAVLRRAGGNGSNGSAGTIEVLERAFVCELVLSDGEVAGVLAHHAGGPVWHRAADVILATGGLGQLFQHTTNPPEATGDGLAMAARAGAVLADLEFIQFHPTALDVPADPAPLVTEALRGEGAILITGRGIRFMPAIHARAELAPRDIVARAVHARQAAGHRVFLDARAAVGERFPTRFPTVWKHCLRHGLDPRFEPIPVTPAAHYAMAGVAVDAYGRTSLHGLWACGEVTSTGVHGANRLASNSLLEALVFGARLADELGSSRQAPSRLRAGRPSVSWPRPGTASGGVDSADFLRQRVRELMWREVGLSRHGDSLERALGELTRMAKALVPPLEPRQMETRNLLTVGILAAAAALARDESRGCHWRSDFPERDPRFERRLFWTASSENRHFPLCPASPFPATLSQREIA